MDRMSTILSRQNINDPNNPNDGAFANDDNVPFWWTRNGQIVRWSIFLGIIALVFSFLTIGYCHARRRIKKGLAPLPYHRWMLNRHQRARYDPTYQDPAANYYPYNGAYNMHPMPPPVYDPSAPMPPVYQPPAGASKVDPTQWATTNRPTTGGEPSPSYAAPPGPPPGVQTNYTGTSNASNNPYRP